MCALVSAFAPAGPGWGFEAALIPENTIYLRARTAARRVEHETEPSWLLKTGHFERKRGKSFLIRPNFCISDHRIMIIIESTSHSIGRRVIRIR